MVSMKDFGAKAKNVGGNEGVQIEESDETED